MPWIVKLVRPPKAGYFQQGYFPRKFYYKRDAEELRAEVEAKGGEAVVQKASRQERGK